MNIATSNLPLPDPLLAGRVIGGPASARIRIDNREYINFHGSGYLALSNVPEIRSAVLRTLKSGAPFSRQISAILGAIDPIFADVERLGAAFCGTEASVYFASGYLTGMVGLASWEQAFDLIALDEVAHYSLRDAAKLSGLPIVEFAHCDPGSVRDVLKRGLPPKARPLLVTDGAFAMSGRIPPLNDYANVLAPYDGRLFVDEAHAFGVVGNNGRGAAEYCDVEQVARVGTTLSKALCAQGALISCSATVALRLRAAPVIRGACAGSPLSAVAAAASLSYLAKHPESRSDLRATTDYLRGRIRSIGFDVIDSPAPIVSFQCPSRDEMQAMQRRAFDRGIYILYSDYIGAGANGMLRCSVFRDHSRQDIDALVDALR